VLIKRLIREGLLKRTDEAPASVLPQVAKPALVA
jgi:hypothetical protein